MAFKRMLLHLAAPNGLHFSRSHSCMTAFNNDRAGMTISLTGFKVPARFMAHLPSGSVTHTYVDSLHSRKLHASNVVCNNSHVKVCFLRGKTSFHGSGMMCSQSNSSFSALHPNVVS